METKGRSTVRKSCSIFRLYKFSIFTIIMGEGKVRVIDVYCKTCDTQLYRYKKEGEGHLAKCYKDEILRDFTDGSLSCPLCHTEFARERMIHGRPAHKIIQGKVYVR